MSDPVLWRLGLVEVRWHDLWHALSLAAGLLAATLCARLGGLPWALWRDTLLWTLPEALLAARVGHVAMHLNTYLLVPLQVWQVWDGGYALGAGVAAGLLAGWRFCRARRLRAAPLAASAAVGLAVWQLGLVLAAATSAALVAPLAWWGPAAVLLAALVGARWRRAWTGLLPLWLAVQAAAELAATLRGGPGSLTAWLPPLGWLALLLLAALLLRREAPPQPAAPA